MKSLRNYLPAQILGKQRSSSSNDNGVPTGDGLYFTDMNMNALGNEDISSSYTYDSNANGRNGDQGVYNLKQEVAMPQEFLTQFGGPAPTGPITLPELIKYTGGKKPEFGVTEEKFKQLNPSVQKGILSDPATFLKGQMGFGPKAAYRDIAARNAPWIDAESPNAQYAVKQGFEKDLLKFGGEGGSKDPKKIYWDPKVGLVQDPQNYTPDSNNNDFLDYAPYIIAALSGGVGLATGAFSGATAGAVTGGISGTVTGFNAGDGNFGDVVKGGAKGAAIGYIGGGIGEGLNTVVGFNPTIADATWSAGATPLSGAAVNLGKNVVIGGIKGGVSSGVNGGDIGAGVVGGIKGAGIGTVSSYAPSILPNTGNPIINKVIGGGLKGGISSALNGGDFSTGALSGAIPSTGNPLLDMILNKGVNSALFSKSTAKPGLHTGGGNTNSNPPSSKAQKAAANFMQIISRNSRTSHR